ncbi:hypothetical protein [Embleya sp. MST-111070]|uniref:hypothetical protein n=1 Tax=Embleya sp. MST-111070 TaxID=3398231 RepID=UPI003F733A05
MNTVAKRLAKWFLGAVVSVFLVILALIGLVVFLLVYNGEPPDRADIDKVANAPKVRAAQRTAVGDLEAAYTTLEQAMGGRARPHAEAVSDVCGASFRDRGLWHPDGWSDVNCEREVVRAYVLDGPQAENATVVAVALEAAGWARNGPASVNPGTPPCPAPASSAVDAPSTPIGHEPACRIDAILPSRVSLYAEFWAEGLVPARFPSQLRDAADHSTTSTTARIDIQAITSASRPPGSSVVIVSILAPYFTQQQHS